MRKKIIRKKLTTFSGATKNLKKKKIKTHENGLGNLSRTFCRDY